MKYLVCPRLEKLTRSLTETTVGDRVVNGKVEAYSCKAAGSDKRLAKSLEKNLAADMTKPRHSPGHKIESKSPCLGSMSDSSTRKLYTYLIGTMNASFPDYDFSNLKPDLFLPLSLSNVMNEFNGSVLDEVDKTSAGFRSEFWSAIDDVICLRNSELFMYNQNLPDCGTLWSFNCFIYNKKEKKIVFCCFSAKRSRGEANYEEEEEDEDMYSNDEEELNTGYIETDLLDMDDLGVKQISISDCTWTDNTKFGPLGSLAVFQPPPLVGEHFQTPSEHFHSPREQFRSPREHFYSPSGQFFSPNQHWHSPTPSKHVHSPAPTPSKHFTPTPSKHFTPTPSKHFTPTPTPSKHFHSPMPNGQFHSPNERSPTSSTTSSASSDTSSEHSLHRISQPLGCSLSAGSKKSPLYPLLGSSSRSIGYQA